MATITLSAPAKLNLFLEVTGKRPDGYHELVTVMQEIALADTLEAEPAGDFSLEVSGLEIPPGGENLVLKAAKRLAEVAGAREGAAFRLTKRIPAGAGLGGGSSDAAAALKACARLWKLDEALLPAVAAEVGSDVPFFLAGGTALCTGRGEKVQPLKPLPETPITLVWPGFALPTRDVYGALAPAGSPRKVEPFLAAMEKGDLPLFNRLEEAALKVQPGLVELRQWMSQAGFRASAMTGSGSAFYGLGERALPIPMGWKLFKTKTASTP